MYILNTCMYMLASNVKRYEVAAVKHADFTRTFGPNLILQSRLLFRQNLDELLLLVYCILALFRIGSTCLCTLGSFVNRYEVAAVKHADFTRTFAPNLLNMCMYLTYSQRSLVTGSYINSVKHANCTRTFGPNLILQSRLLFRQNLDELLLLVYCILALFRIGSTCLCTLASNVKRYEVAAVKHADFTPTFGPNLILQSRLLFRQNLDELLLLVYCILALFRIGSTCLCTLASNVKRYEVAAVKHADFTPTFGPNLILQSRLLFRQNLDELLLLVYCILALFRIGSTCLCTLASNVKRYEVAAVKHADFTRTFGPNLILQSRLLFQQNLDELLLLVYCILALFRIGSTCLCTLASNVKRYEVAAVKHADFTRTFGPNLILQSRLLFRQNLDELLLLVSLLILRICFVNVYIEYMYVYAS